MFEARFAHTAASLGALDYYFADSSVAPALGNQAATLSFGEISAVDLAEGDFVLTITQAGDPDAVVYVSGTETFAAQGNFIVTPFDGSVANSAPIVVRALNTLGSSFSMPDTRFPPAIEFVNAAIDFGTSDIFDDEMLTSKRVADLAYLDVSAELNVTAGDNTFILRPLATQARCDPGNDAVGVWRYPLSPDNRRSRRRFRFDQRGPGSSPRADPRQVAGSPDIQQL